MSERCWKKVSGPTLLTEKEKPLFSLVITTLNPPITTFGVFRILPVLAESKADRHGKMSLLAFMAQSSAAPMLVLAAAEVLQNTL